jgi:hypothetical protein
MNQKDINLFLDKDMLWDKFILLIIYIIISIDNNKELNKLSKVNLMLL